MVSTKIIFAHLTVVLAVLFCSLEMTTANLQCKNRAINIIMEQCSGGFAGRKKRDLEEAPPKIEENPAQIETSQDHSPVKRQLGADPTGAIAGMAAPIMEDMITGAISGARRGYRTQLSGQLTGAPRGYPMAIAPVPRAFPGSPQYYVAAPPPPSSLFQPEARYNKGFLPQESGDDLGFDLTDEEVDDLYDEISNRISRNSGKSADEIMNIIQAAAKCCQNEELCRKEPSIIPCV